jgi:phosphoribosylformylglycinamidine synthase
VLLGTTREELAGSEWAWVEHAHLGGLPPRCDLAAEQALGAVLVDAARGGMIGAAHDLSDGGLAQALVEGCLRFGVGARVSLTALGERDGVEEFVALWSESAGRVVVAVDRSELAGLAQLCRRHGVPLIELGATDAEPVLAVDGLFSIGLDELRTAHEATIPAVFEH